MKLSVEKEMRRAKVHAGRGEVSQATEIYNAVLLAFPKNRRARQELERLKPAHQNMPQERYDRLVALFREGKFSDVVTVGEPLASDFPDDSVLQFMLGAANTGLNRLKEAIVNYRLGLAIKPDYAQGHYNLANVLEEQGALDEAMASYRNAIELRPDFAEAHYGLGVVLQNQGALEEATASYERALAVNPDFARAENNLGVLLEAAGADDRAATHYRRAVEIDPGFAEAYHNLAGIRQRQGGMEDAAGYYRRAIEIKPDYAEAHHNLGIVLKDMGSFKEAGDQWRQAVAVRPDYAEARNSLGVLAQEKGLLDEAMAHYASAIRINPDYAEAHSNLGAAALEQGRVDEAMAHYSRSLEINPDYAEAHSNLGVAFLEKGLLEESAASQRRALDINPDYVAAHNNLGIVLQNNVELDESVANYARALEINPDFSAARAQKLHQQALMCDWAAIREDAGFIPALGIEGESAAPFPMLVMDDNPERNLLRSKRYTQDKYTRTALPAAPRPSERPGRLRIGYFSADFHNHATMCLIAKLFAVHDRAGFEIHAYSYGPDKKDDARRALVESVDSFHDVTDRTDEAVARLAREHGIDIAVDLKGHTQHARTGIFAYRAAPVQIAYLGYPGTTGAPFMDYMIADETVVPADHHEFYSESIITLPDSYQVNDDRRPISRRPMSRAEFGLPQDAFVFACFNTAFKIGPEEFDTWMRLLERVDNSVLWLLKSNRWMESSLRAEAKARNIDAARLIFAERMPVDEHLARSRLADLFLDTFACNAHTTASDALWAGLPLVTKLGEGFAARVAGSLLNAVGLPELITETIDDYERLALDLATNRQRLDAVRQKLAQGKESKPLFDTERFARHIEDAYRQAYGHYFEGRAPAAIKVEVCAPPASRQEPPAGRPGDAPEDGEDLRDRVSRLLTLYSRGRLEEAAGEAALLLGEQPGNALLHNFHGVVKAGLNQPDEAVASYRRALEINPDYAEAHFNLGNVLAASGAYEDAEASFKAALALKPDNADGHFNLGLAQQNQGALDRAVASYDRVLERDPGYDRAREQKLHQLARMCDWSAFAGEAGSIPGLGIRGKSVSPFSMLAMEDHPERHRLRSEKACREMFAGADAPPFLRPGERPERLRIGYFSADFRNHATMYLMAKLFEVHDRDRFEICAYSYGPDADDAMRKRLVDAVDLFRDVRHMSDAAVAELAREDRIDIAVDLKGFTQHSRLGIFACRAAPVQIAYLGYPGTTGAPFMDYIVADDVVIPPAGRRHFSEQVISLPHAYQVNDDARPISERAMTRAEFDLPQEAFVFCCFNSSYKIGAEEFDIWMRLLGEVDGSVLWLLKTNPWAEANLRREAELRGVDGTRLVFAERLPADEHLARYRLADLFLDTFTYNAHTTASDALWVGLPLVTKLGQGFAARVAGSLAKAVGLPELMTRTEAEYEALALDLASNPQRLVAMKKQLAENRTASPLFDTKLFAGHLEEAYGQAYQRYFDGKEPAAIAIGE